MFYSEQLLSKDGPLACAWLAANLEKKLTKQQLLSASVTESAQAVEDSSKVPNTQSSQQQTEPMALRLSGQLLYGIVRIYYRKSKYLYEDVSDILMKLKASFSTSKSVILPLEATALPSLKNVTLADNVTEADLLYRQPVDFDSIFESQHPQVNQRASALAVDTETETFADNTSVDDSIEIPRRSKSVELEDDLGDAGDLDLNFDLSENLESPSSPADSAADESIEIGRGAVTPNASAMDTIGDIELPDLDEPQLEADIGLDNDTTNEPSTPPDATATVAASKALQYQKMDVVRTSSRRLVVDSVTELSAQTLRANQRRYLQDRSRISRKHQLELEGGFLSNFASNLHISKKQRTEQEHQEQSETGSQVEQDNIGQDFTDIDLAPPSPVGSVSMSLGNDDLGGDMGDNSADVDSEHETETEVTAPTIKKAAIVANTLKSMMTVEGKSFTDVPVTFSDVLDEEEKSQAPLGTTERKKATSTFFELLVLAGNDNIKLSQTSLFGEISIEAKDSLQTIDSYVQ